MATLAASFSPNLILHRFIFIFPRATPPFHHFAKSSEAKQSFPLLKTTSGFSARFLSSSPVSSPSVSQQLASDVVLLDNEQIEPEATAAATSESLKNLNCGVVKTPPPSLSVKEKKELASYAHSLGKKLKSQQVGKSGVTDTVITALIETLEANELLKLKIHGTCPGELEDVIKQLEESSGSVVVGQIGRTLILYRPSMTKLKAEERKKQAQSVYLKRQPPSSKQSTQSSKRSASVLGQEPRNYGRGRRGSSRY